ncbi:MAG: hypothetical protein K6G12_01565 [Lachnospiraceae bacterium]|nr:hypothetical protein [Lachnospiraceae bacterium]
MNKQSKPIAVRLIETGLMILTIIVVFFIIFFIVETVDQYNYYNHNPHSKDSYKYAALDEDYARVVSYYKEGEQFGKPSAGYKEYYDIGEYFYCASIEKAIRNLNNAELESYWESRRQQAMENVGIASEVIVKIDDLLDR